MIELTKLTGENFFMNPNLIEIIEVTPDTLITMTNGKKYYALEPAEEIIAKIQEYYQKINSPVRKVVKAAPDEEES